MVKILSRMRFTLFLLSSIFIACQPGFKEADSINLENASVQISGKTITANTGNTIRVWKLSELGLSTINFRTIEGKNLVTTEQNSTDWLFPWMKNETEVELISIESKIDNDEGFVDDFIRTTAVFHYPASKVGLKYDIWTMPEAPGFRTQISLKKLDGFNVDDDFAQGTVELMASEEFLVNGEAIGYFNDTQHRNMAETPILKTETINVEENQEIDWANALIVSSDKKGFVLIKESHKCANQQGVNTGGFKLAQQNVLVTGAGLDLEHLSSQYQPCWATWSIAFDGNKTDAKLALKQFDRKRYPIDPNRDIYIMSNTWGSGSSGSNSKYASREENILRELKVSKELGLDLLQIDDGWQGIQYNKWETVATAKYKKPTLEAKLANNATYDVYPEGWGNVRQTAKDLGVKLGLWAAWTIPQEDLVKNYQLGDFRSYKLDFAKLHNYKTLRNFEDKVRGFILKTDHKVRVNWDVTENPPRIGYYFGREYGNIYLENRKPLTPVNVLYHPWLVLRDAWHVAKYTNLNKFQITYQNVDMVNREESDAFKHKHDYALAATLMGSPIFFQEIHLLSDDAKATIKPLIAKYKSVRNEMYKGYVFAIGEEPSNASFPGFQNYNPETQSGYLTLFREINCDRETFNFNLNFMDGRTLEVQDLMSGKTWTVTDFKDLKVTFEESGTFKFLKYSVR